MQCTARLGAVVERPWPTAIDQCGIRGERAGQVLLFPYQGELNAALSRRSWWSTGFPHSRRLVNDYVASAKGMLSLTRLN